jgi:hypothetical protein
MRELFQSWMKRVFLIPFISTVTLSVVADLLRHVSTSELWIGAGVISTAAYFIRERRRPHNTKPRSTSNGERSPVMPRRKV